jgi:hypothetical protein
MAVVRCVADWRNALLPLDAVCRLRAAGGTIVVFTLVDALDLFVAMYWMTTPSGRPEALQLCMHYIDRVPPHPRVCLFVSLLLEDESVSQ